MKIGAVYTTIATVSIRFLLGGSCFRRFLHLGGRGTALNREQMTCDSKSFTLFQKVNIRASLGVCYRP